MIQVTCNIKSKKTKKQNKNKTKQSKTNQLTGWHFWEEQVESSSYQ